MKVRKFLRSMIVFALLALLALPVAAGAAGVTPSELDGMAVDPQSWKLQRDMTWHDYKPNPVIDWASELNPASLNNTFSHDMNPETNRKIIGGIILFDFLDRKFITKGGAGSDPLGYFMYDPDGGGMSDTLSRNPVVDVTQLIADERGITREAALADPQFDNWFARWWADFLNKPQEVNHFAGIDEFWRENSFGKWATDLNSYGPFTVPFFEFERRDSYQTSADVPPSFRTVSGAQTFNFDREAQSIAVSNDIPFNTFDFFFLLHAGYDESGVWYEFGRGRFPTRQDIPYEMGPGPRMTQVEEFFTDDVKNNGAEMLKVYAARYPHQPLFQTRLTEYEELANKLNILKELVNTLTPPVPAEVAAALATAQKAVDDWVFKLTEEDWAWVDGYNDQTIQNTRYVPFTSWAAAVGGWGHASTFNYQGRTIRFSTQGESDGMATFAHEFGHISEIGDNYGSPWVDTASPATEPWELMSRGSFNGPYGDHARWTVPAVQAESVPSHLMVYNKNEYLGYYDDGDLLELSVEELAGQTPLVADIVARNIPLADDSFYPGLKAFGLNQGDYYKGIKLNFGNNEYKVANALRANPSADITVDEEWKDKAAIVTTGFTDTRKPADSMYVEVVDQSGYDSFNHDYGVLIVRGGLRVASTTGNNAGRQQNPFHSIIDSHLHDIAMIDYELDGVPTNYPLGHNSQLIDAAFHAGVSFTDTGYYATQYGNREGNNPSNWEIAKNGSLARGEPRDGRDIVSGNTVNEFYDEPNGLHYYILEKNLNPGKPGREFLSYQVGILHDKGEAVNGSLRLTPQAFVPADSGNYARQTFELVNTGAASADIVRITLSGRLAEGRTQDIQVITGRNETKTVTVPKPFSEQNAVILNNIYAVKPGETVSFDVFVKANASLDVFPFRDLVVTASSESNADNVTSHGIPETPADVVAALAANDSRNVTVSFTSPAASDVVYFNLISDGVVVASGDSSPFTLTNLTAGREYRFAVSAVNALGTSSVSALSNPVTPSTVTVDNRDIAAAKAAIEGAAYGPARQADVSDSAAAKSIVQNFINGLELSGVTAAIVDAGFSPAVAGTAANPLGNAGFYSFNVTLSKGAGTVVMTNPKSLSITATPFEQLYPVNKGNIGGQEIDLDANVSGTGWSWSAADNSLTLSGGNVGAIALDKAADVIIWVIGNASSNGISKTGSGSLTIDSPGVFLTEGIETLAGEKLTVNVTAGSAITAEGDIIIESGVLEVGTTDAMAAAIESKSGSVSVIKDADLTVSANGGSAIRGARDVTIGTAGTVTANTSGSGYALSAGNAVAITSGTINITAADEAHAYSVTPSISDEAVVTVTPVEDEDTGDGGSGGCNAGYALLAFAAIIPFVIRKRK